MMKETDTTLTKGWDIYLECCPSASKTPFTEEVRRAFFAGAYHVIYSAISQIRPPNEVHPVQTSVNIVNKLWELEAEVVAMAVSETGTDQELH